jgi:cob(I)alamin adenosyltransferase
MLYTKKGDKGTTKLFNTKKGKRLSKTGTVFDALGQIDELNSLLGICRAENKKTYIKVGRKKILVADIVFDVQDALFVVQAELAGAPKKIKRNFLAEIEGLINDIERKMPPIKTFKIAGETRESAWFDYCRAVSRQAERRVLIHTEKHPKAVSETTKKFLNRLSSLLYACGRVIAYQKGAKEKSPTYKASK